MAGVRPFRCSNTDRVTRTCHIGGANGAGQKRKQTIEIATNDRDPNQDPIVGRRRGLSKRPDFAETGANFAPPSPDPRSHRRTRYSSSITTTFLFLFATLHLSVRSVGNSAGYYNHSVVSVKLYCPDLRYHRTTGRRKLAENLHSNVGVTEDDPNDFFSFFPIKSSMRNSNLCSKGRV